MTSDVTGIYHCQDRNLNDNDTGEVENSSSNESNGNTVDEYCSDTIVSLSVTENIITHNEQVNATDLEFITNPKIKKYLISDYLK